MLFCKACGAPVKPGQNFCTKCGVSFKGPDSVLQPGTKFNLRKMFTLFFGFYALTNLLFIVLNRGGNLTVFGILAGYSIFAWWWGVVIGWGSKGRIRNWEAKETGHAGILMLLLSAPMSIMLVASCWSVIASQDFLVLVELLVSTALAITLTRVYHIVVKGPSYEVAPKS